MKLNLEVDNVPFLIKDINLPKNQEVLLRMLTLTQIKGCFFKPMTSKKGCNTFNVSYRGKNARLDWTFFLHSTERMTLSYYYSRTYESFNREALKSGSIKLVN